jgi:hypothetical protein
MTGKDQDLGEFGLQTSAALAGGPFPSGDALDLRAGAGYIPGEVTDARRRGTQVTFVQQCSPCCWYWQMPDGSRIYHSDWDSYEALYRRNHAGGQLTAGAVAGPCPDCGNQYTAGEVVPVR